MTFSLGWHPLIGVAGVTVLRNPGTVLIAGEVIRGYG